jgi:glucokinase
MMEMHEEYVLGIDIGGTKTCISSITRDGRMIDTERFPSCLTNLDNSIDHIFSNIDKFFSLHKYSASPLRIGIGLRGYIDKKNGIWLSTMMIPDFKPVNLKAKIVERFSIETVMDNDVHAATLAELYFGAGKEYEDFLFLNVGTGIAVGIVSGKRLIRGASNFAGEFGHTMVEVNGEPCVCGLSGCLEPIASGMGLIEQTKKLMPKFPASILKHAENENRLYSSTIFKACDEGDELARFVTGRAVRGLGTGIISLINLLNPQAILLGGGVITDGWLLPRLKDYIDLHVSKNISNMPAEFKISSLGSDYVGVLGAACLGWEDFEINNNCKGVADNE